MTDVRTFPPTFISDPRRDPRLTASFDRLNRDDYRIESVIAESTVDDWPGDLAGRLLLSLSRFARAGYPAHTRAKALADAILDAISERGYFGAPVGIVVDEQQLASHGWVVAALIQFSSLNADPAWIRAAHRITDELTLPGLARLADYPRERRDDHSVGNASGTAVSEIGGWRLSSDIWCVLLTLNGLVPLYIVSPRPEVHDAIHRLAGVLAEIDLVEQSAQLHATLAAARALSDFALYTADADLMKLVANIYDVYTENARTLNYAPFNWFGRPDSWTEPCAIVDSLGVAHNLALATGLPRYIEDALRIEYNALGFAQRRDGSFGLDSIATAAHPVLRTIEADARWCCTMRGALGLLEAREQSIHYDREDRAIRLTGTYPGQIRFDNTDGEWLLALSGTGPTIGREAIEVLQSPPQARAIAIHFWAGGRWNSALVEGNLKKDLEWPVPVLEEFVGGEGKAHFVGPSMIFEVEGTSRKIAADRAHQWEPGDDVVFTAVW